MSDTLLRVEDLKIYYPVAGSGFGKKEFVKAVDGVTFEVKKRRGIRNCRRVRLRKIHTGKRGLQTGKSDIGPCVSGWRRYYRVQ